MNIVYSFIGVALDQKKNGDKINHWRPTIALATSNEIHFDELHLLWQSNYRSLSEELIAELKERAPQLKVVSHIVDFDDPWDFEEVYSKLYDFAAEQKPDPEANDYYIHISTGTHVMQISWFLLNESHHLPGKLLQSHPATGKNSRNFTIIDLDLARYDMIGSTLCRQTEERPCVSEVRNRHQKPQIQRPHRNDRKSGCPLI